MLSQLSIKNVAVITELDISVNKGITVLTGETGAGKSIIIDSINMLLGNRTNKDIVRFGQEKASVQAVFSNIPKSVSGKLLELDIEMEDDEIILSRQVTKDGKSTARINGVIVPASFLKDISSSLINIHGQHDNQALLNPKKHINFLDEYAEVDELLTDYKKLYIKKCETEKEISMLQTDETEKERQIELLEYQINEIERAKLKSDEEEDLKEELMLLSNAEKITSAVNEAYMSLYDNMDKSSAYDNLSVAVSKLLAVTEYDKTLNEAYETLSSALYSVEDAAHNIKAFAEGIEFSEQALNDVMERLDLISKLKRKYGNDISEILEYLESAKSKLDKITKSEEGINKLKAELFNITVELSTVGKKLSDLRTIKAKELSSELTKALSELNMERALLNIRVNSTDEFYENGMDIVEFMIKTNPGEPLKPLDKIASGGELSRVILAIKSILADSDSIDTMIFDEIDTGVSGSAALKITQKLVKISKSRQVICITHLPSLAAAADTHYLIEKNTDSQMAITTLKELDESAREMELARIIDGENITEISVSHARQMLKSARDIM